MGFEDFCRQNNICVTRCDLPRVTKGFCYLLDGTYYVLLNCNYSIEVNKQSLKHELIHILKNHFNQEVYCESDCEKEVDKIMPYADQYLQNYGINTSV